MDKEKKIIIVILVVSILFSVLSIVINVFISGTDISDRDVSFAGQGGNNGDLNLFVEGNNAGGGE